MHNFVKFLDVWYKDVTSETAKFNKCNYCNCEQLIYICLSFAFITHKSHATGYMAQYTEKHTHASSSAYLLKLIHTIC